jgi:hypothetical protein
VVQNSDPNVGQLVDVLKTGIISGLTFRGLSNTDCEDDKIELLDNLQSFFEESDASLPHPSTNQSIGTYSAGPIDVAEQVQQEEVIKCDKKICQ